MITPYGDTIYQSKKDVKFGIQIVSDSRHINIFDNDISDISWTTAVDPLKADSLLTEAERKTLRNAWPNDNCGPISVLGSDKDAMKDITIEGNEIYKCNPGWSENVTINGYIDTFSVINNLIHDVKNIGIVAAGNYTWVLDPGNGFSTPANQNYSRNGIISGNIVYKCQSPYAASAGIYLDGARNVLIERNQIYQNHVGISVGNETPNSHSGGHIIRNNIVYDNVWTGMVLGSNASNAWVENTKVLNNTFYRNNTQAATLLTLKDYYGQIRIVNGVALADTFTLSGEIVTQRLSNSTDAPGAKIVVQNNIIRSRKGILLSVLDTFSTNSYSSAALVKSNLKTLLDWNYNLYYPEPGYNMNYDFGAAAFTGNTYNFANYKTETGLDSNSRALELYTVPSPDSVFTGGTTFPTRFTLRTGSTAYNIGNPSSSNSGEDDFIYNDRILNSRIDAGALEYYASARPAAPVAAVKETVVTWSVFPNPVVNNATIRLSAKEAGIATVEVWDMAGRLSVKKQIAVTEGANTIQMNNFKKAGFTSGAYLLKVTAARESQLFKLIVQ